METLTPDTGRADGAAADKGAALTVTMAAYVASAVQKAQYPVPVLPQIVFVGRSNVGKSSLINSLTRQKTLAHVSKKPGKTRTINFFSVTLKENDVRREFYLTDLPGYGYAKTGRNERNSWARFIDEYLTTSREIRFVAQLIDVRHELMPIDEEMFRRLTGYGLPVLPIATKTDKIGKSMAQKNIAQWRRKLRIADLPVLPYSSATGMGRGELLDTVWNSLL